MANITKQTQSLSFRLTTTFAVYFCFFAYGTCCNIFGPTWLDLKELINTSMERMSFSISLRSGSFSVGALIGGFIFSYFNRQLLYSIFLFIMGSSIILIPLLPTYHYFLILNSMYGMLSGASDTAVNVWMLEMWQQKSGPFMQALQFFWALGFILAPLISHPFLAEDSINPLISNGTDIIFEEPFPFHAPSSETWKEQRNSSEPGTFDSDINLISNRLSESRLHYPYGIAGSLLCFGSLIILSLYIYKKVEDSRRIRTSDSDVEKPLEDFSGEQEKKQEQSHMYTCGVVGFSCLMVTFFCASEMTTFQYLPTFATHLQLGISKTTASLVLAAHATTFTVGRFMGILLAVKMPSEQILFMDWILISIGNLILLFSDNSENLLWIGSMVAGFGYAAFFPAVFSFLKTKVEVTNLISGLILVSSLFGNASGFPILIGKYIQTVPLVLVYGNFLCMAIIGFTFLMLYILQKKFRKYY